jgi:energy-coupling factor transporter ATP-binding protein EcfA2
LFPRIGLNAEQRKRLTIGVELAAKPELLLFLDEPTSGLDSQTAWAIGDLLRKLADQGQAILCTIHQPSALLFEQFDRMLLLRKGGKMVYFGDLGLDSRTMINYFESQGAPKCEVHMNPAEWMLNVTGAGIGGSTDTDWAQAWIGSKERAERVTEMEEMNKQFANADGSPKIREIKDTYATSFMIQFQWTLVRVFQQYWRTPSYIWSKLLLVIGVVSLSQVYAWCIPTPCPNISCSTVTIRRPVIPRHVTFPARPAEPDILSVPPAHGPRLHVLPNNAALYRSTQHFRGP